jgi:hypothetical protein
MGDCRKMQPRPFKPNFSRFFREEKSDAASRRLLLGEFGGMEKSIRNDGAPIRRTDAPLVVRMSLQLVIPWRLALQLVASASPAEVIILHHKPDLGHFGFERKMNRLL